MLFGESKTKNSCYMSRHSLGLMLRTPNSLTPLCCRIGQNVVCQGFLDKYLTQFHLLTQLPPKNGYAQHRWEVSAVTRFKRSNASRQLGDGRVAFTALPRQPCFCTGTSGGNFSPGIPGEPQRWDLARVRLHRCTCTSSVCPPRDGSVKAVCCSRQQSGHLVFN